MYETYHIWYDIISLSVGYIWRRVMINASMLTYNLIRHLYIPICLGDFWSQLHCLHLHLIWLKKKNNYNQWGIRLAYISKHYAFVRCIKMMVSIKTKLTVSYFDWRNKFILIGEWYLYSSLFRIKYDNHFFKFMFEEET